MGQIEPSLLSKTSYAKHRITGVFRVFTVFSRASYARLSTGSLKSTNPQGATRRDGIASEFRVDAPSAFTTPTITNTEQGEALCRNLQLNHES